ncbi:hypothetical protein TRP8649_04759 [Pelagimonas phthalicica]|uniref:Uncharacterized protein n=1 Tax=Pelagimonas phthalicica TaxID=1037362 RepID=A0A238JJG0_9RHOB|nr:hypothetical protein CLV87_4831 [Pelagimonas phthalicica]SMX30615.1 hypothetical protein TRP8649_04759 [Pelagimonas phthalicica]
MRLIILIYMLVVAYRRYRKKARTTEIAQLEATKGG